jgi:protein TonB
MHKPVVLFAAVAMLHAMAGGAHACGIPNARLNLAGGQSAPNATRRIGGSVSPPVVLYAPIPVISEASKKLMEQKRNVGNVVVYLQVDTNGRATHVRVLKGVGLGLDESAVKAVRLYRFRPAMEDGQPVVVEMNVEVNFNVF